MIGLGTADAFADGVTAAVATLSAVGATAVAVLRVTVLAVLATFVVAAGSALGFASDEASVLVSDLVSGLDSADFFVVAPDCAVACLRCPRAFGGSALSAFSVVVLSVAGFGSALGLSCLAGSEPGEPASDDALRPEESLVDVPSACATPPAIHIVANAHNTVHNTATVRRTCVPP